MKKKILFMSEEEARTTLYCAGYSGDFEMLVVGNIERNKTIQFHPMCDRFINLKNTLTLEGDTSALVVEIIEVIKREAVDLLLPISLVCLKLVDQNRAAFAKHVNIGPCPTEEVLELLDDKYKFYQFCLQNGISHPKSVLAKSWQDIDPANVGVEFPILIKPLLGAGGFSTLVFAENRAQLETFLNSSEEKKQKYFPALVQEYFDGEDIDLNGYSLNGKILASSVMRTEFYEKNRELSFTSFVRDDEVKRLGEKVLALSGYSGPANIDMRIRKSDGELMLIEVNPRYWARVAASIFDGINFVDVGIRASLGEDVKVESKAGGGEWISSFGLLLKAILKDGKLSYIKHVFAITKFQIQLVLFNRRLDKKAAKLLAQ